jgi:transcriptional regulator with XRE-family HTH domain
MPVRLGEKVRYLRKRRGFTQGELADKLALTSQGHISNIEQGLRPPSATLVATIAKFFAISTEFFLRDDIAEEQVDAFMLTTMNMQSTFSNVGDALRWLREQHGLSQSELARRLDAFAQSYISEIESGAKEPSLDMLIRLATFFNISTDVLLLGMRDDAASS